MNQTPIERLAAMQVAGTRAVAEAFVSTVPPEDRAELLAAVDEVMTANAAEILQTHVDHLRLALTDEQAAEVLAYVEREKPACWDRYESATRLGSAAANVIMGVK